MSNVFPKYILTIKGSKVKGLMFLCSKVYNVFHRPWSQAD